MFFVVLNHANIVYVDTIKPIIYDNENESFE